MSLITTEQVTQFEEQGYLVVPDVFDPVDLLAPVLADFAHTLTGIEEALAVAGRLPTAAFAELRAAPLTERLMAVAQHARTSLVQPFDINVPRRGLTPSTPMLLSPSVFELLTNAHVLDVVEAFIGPEIELNPVQHVRIKYPSAVTSVATQDTVPQRIGWHQDNGVVTPDADATPTLTVWIPLTDATTETGCLAGIPGSHRRGLVDHCLADGQLQVPSRLIDETQLVPLPIGPGSILLLHRQTIHCSLDNTSPGAVRISYDLRYQPAGMPSGRASLPSFIVRSRRSPESVVRDPAEWRRRWLDARDQLAQAGDAPKPHRWTLDSEPRA